MNIEELTASLPDKERSNINEQKFTQRIPDVQYANGGQLKEWKTLSMRERANIIRNSVQNHFANGGSMIDISIDDIRHQYDEGEEEDIYAKANAILDERIKQQMMKNRPSYEDWINRERNKVTQAAFEYSNQRTSPSYIMQDNPYKTKEEWLSAMNSIIEERQKELNDSIKLNTNQPPMIQQMNISIAQQKLDDAIWEKNQGYSSKIPANSCLTTATDNYVKVTGDKSYGANLNSYFQNNHPGYEVVPGFKDAVQGDIVQLLEDNGEAKHGMIYAGQNDQGQYIFNNSAGGSEDIAYKKGISFRSINNDKNPNDHVQILRFIGNDQWNKDKEEDYNLRYPAFMQGGNLFQKGGPKETLEENSPADLMRNDNIGFQQGYYPEVTIPKQSLYEAADNSGVTLVPLLGDAIDAGKVIYDTSQGNYKQAALGAGFLLLPNIVEKPLKKGIKTFVSKLDWSPDNWFYKLSQGARSPKHNPYTVEDANILASHLDEYADIEQKAFEQGQFILDNKGNVIVKDNPEMSPQEWIIRHSKAMEPWNDERISTGVSKRYREDFVEDPNNVVTWGTTTSPNDVLEYASSPAGGEIPMTKDLVDDMLRIKRENVEDLQQAIIEAKNQKRNYIVRYNKAQNLYLAEQRLERLKKNLQRYEDEGEDLVLNGGQVYQIITPKIAKQSPVVDAQGFNWDRFPYEGSPSGYTSTDHLVNSNRLEGYDISNIINVRDTKKELGLDPLNEKIINNGVPRKSILGNTGDLDINKKGLFTEIALPLGLTALVKTLNIEKAQEEKLFGEGGNTSVNEAQPKNDWRKDSQNKQVYIKDLDKWISENPTFKGSNGAIYNTADFRDVLIQLVGHESSYRPDASTGSYTGYYQIHKNENPTLNQHTRAFKHLDRLFQDNITDYDLKRAKELGINHAALLMKYWNQGNHVNNYLHHGIDHEDGAGTKISLYGNDMDADFDMTNYVNKAITDDYALVPKGGNLWNIAKLARNKYITNYANQRNLIEEYTKEYNPSFGKKVLQVGDTIWLTPTNIPEEPVIPQKVQQTDYKVNYDNPQDLPWYNVFLDNIKRTLFGWEPPEGRYDFARGGYLNKK